MCERDGNALTCVLQWETIIWHTVGRVISTNYTGVELGSEVLNGYGRSSRGSVTLESTHGSDTGLCSSAHSQVTALSLVNSKQINVCTNPQPISQQALGSGVSRFIYHMLLSASRNSLMLGNTVNTAEVPVEYKHINWVTSTFNNTWKMISSLFYDDILVSIHLKCLYYAKCSSFCFGGLL